MTKVPDNDRVCSKRAACFVVEIYPRARHWVHLQDAAKLWWEDGIPRLAARQRAAAILAAIELRASRPGFADERDDADTSAPTLQEACQGQF
ncbi:hypothetical protein P8C59_008593 [Phyllachora maydis]|uniref:Uncharacterized protein n=1 Tax=Phyllachora maydis TaxID=1825666 RepID=A0AAD9MH24_9PEZI|nr:hypothetical protein P8C59_008593 [Phyllachora maydis]